MTSLRPVLTLTAVVLVASACGGGDSEPAAGSVEEELDVLAVVEEFMQARQEGLPADEFLAADVATAYTGHENGLWLHDDTLPAGPGGEFSRFAVTVAPGEEGTWTADVRTQVVCNGDAAPNEMSEVLTVSSDTVVEAKRTDDTGDDCLPPGVAEKREQIYGAAVKQQYDGLASLLDPATFNYSLGEEGDPIGYWRRQEKDEIPVLGDVLPTVLHTRFGKNEDIYVWPSATSKLVQDWTEEDVQAIRTAGYTEADIQAFREQIGGYAGWRVGIRENGTWLYFIAGE
jgi:hypothetical protein